MPRGKGLNHPTTEYGKSLRTIRIQHDHVLGDMAKATGFSVAMISAVENGTRSVPPGLTDKVVQAYELDKSWEKQLQNQEAWQNGYIKVKLEKKPESPAATETVQMLARKLVYLDDSTLESIQKLIQDALNNTQAKGEEYGK